MAKSQHTPGPYIEKRLDDDQWLVLAERPYGRHILVANCTTQENMEFVRAACNACMSVNPDRPEAVAKALPELVKALERLAGIAGGIPVSDDDYDDLGPVLDKARAALAAVKGADNG